MADSVRQPLLLALVVVHLVMALLALTDDQQRGATHALAVAHLLVAAAAAAARRTGLPAWPAILLGDLTFLWDWGVTDSLETPLFFAACWARNLSAALPTFLLPARRGLVVQGTTVLGVPATMLVLRPDLDPAFPVAVGVTGVSIMVVTRVGMSFLSELAATADSEADVAEERRRTLAAQRVASETALEDARVLHDTVINTLAAIASGGGALQDLGVVRERCAHDVSTLESLRSGAGDQSVGLGLQDLPPVAGIEVVRTGLVGEALVHTTERLPTATLRALHRSTVELVQNAAKHSGAAHVVLDVAAHGETLVVTVADEGRGFGGQVVEGRGLERSVLQRCQAAGIAVEVDTAPGRGTSVVLRALLTGPAEAPLDEQEWEQVTARTLAGVVRRSGLLYALGLTVVGLVLAATNHHGAITTEYVMVVLNVLALAAFVTAPEGGPTGGRTAVLVLVPPLSFAMTAFAVDLGRDQPVLWQAIGPTGPLVLLLGSATARRAFLTSVGLYAATAAGLALVVAPDSTEAAVVVLVAAAVGLGLVAGWRSFMATIEVIGGEAAAARRRAELTRVELTVRAEADRTRERWRAAGLDDALGVLTTDVRYGVPAGR
jgi:signal transduction histidine kinase